MSDLGCQLIAEVRKVAADNPLFQYYNGEDESCKYISNGGPDCLIGHALWNIGLIDADWQGDRQSRSDIRNIVEWAEWELDASEVDWLAHVQQSQDNSCPWGRCIRQADDRA